MKVEKWSSWRNALFGTMLILGWPFIRTWYLTHVIHRYYQVYPCCREAHIFITTVMKSYSHRSCHYLMSSISICYKHMKHLLINHNISFICVWGIKIVLIKWISKFSVFFFPYDLHGNILWDRDHLE